LTKNITREQLIDVAKQAQEIKELDWGMIPISEDAVFSKITDAIVTGYGSIDSDYKDLVLLAALVSLSVQTFVLNQQKLELLHTVRELKQD
jgi:hypothetical protein